MANLSQSAIVTSPVNPIPARPPFSTRDLVIAVAVIGTVFAALIFGIPYATGYGASRTSVFAYTTNLWNLDEWQHCWLVLPISAVIVWMRRDQLATLPVTGSWFGVAPIAAGLLGFWAGYRVDNYFIGIASLMLLLAGSIVFLLGWRWMRALAFPWAFLFFALPLLFLESMLAFRLRLLMSDASVVILNGIGINAIQQGTAILSAPNALLQLPRGAGFSVDVADPCSGIRSLFALTMVTALYAYFAVKPIWKQWLLFACAIPLAVMGNMARILVLTLGTIAVGPEFAIGSLEEPSFFHSFAGYLVFVVALLGMIGVSQLLMAHWPSVWATARARFRVIAAQPTAAAPSRRSLQTAAGPEKPFEDAY